MGWFSRRFGKGKGQGSGLSQFIHGYLEEQGRYYAAERKAARPYELCLCGECSRRRFREFWQHYRTQKGAEKAQAHFGLMEQG